MKNDLEVNFVDEETRCPGIDYFEYYWVKLFTDAESV